MIEDIIDTSNLNIHNRVAFWYINSSMDLQLLKEAIDKYISNSEIIALTLIISGSEYSYHMDEKTKEDFCSWLNSLDILLIAVVDNNSYINMLELIMICDMRLSGSEISLTYPSEKLKRGSDIEKYLKLVIGNERTDLYDTNSPEKALDLGKLYAKRIINQTIDTNNVEVEVLKFLEKIVGGKEDYQIKYIKKCFKSYKSYGLEGDRERLFAEEYKYFCILTVKNQMYLRKENE